MKTLTIGDIHGRDDWKFSCSLPNEYDKIIFVGDYTDSFVKSNVEILHNLKEIIEFKKKFPDKVVLLYGNHDLQYALATSVGDRTYACSGFRPESWYDLNDLFKQNKELFQPIYQYKNYLWTHAGITKQFMHHIEILRNSEKESIENIVNYMFEHTVHLFWCSFMRGGPNPIPGIFWADKSETMHEHAPWYNQIVGHTPIKEIKTHSRTTILQNGNEKLFLNSSITYVDNENVKSYILDIK